MASLASAHSRTLPPVILIIYNRNEHLARVIGAIKDAGVSRVYLVADGPKSSGDVETVMSTRRLALQLLDGIKVERIFAEHNLGLRARILSGLSEVFSRESVAIILEDDCLPNQEFFRYCHDLSKSHLARLGLGIVSGNNFGSVFPNGESYFPRKNSNIWGWMTWAATWQEFDNWLKTGAPLQEHLQTAQSSIESRYLRFKYKRLIRLRKKFDSWAIDFSVFLRVRGYPSFEPRSNLVVNLGFGANATHTNLVPFDFENSFGETIYPLEHPATTHYARSVELSEGRQRVLILGKRLAPSIFRLLGIRFSSRDESR